MRKKKDIQRVDDQDAGDKPVDELTAGVMVQDYLREKYPTGHAFVTETDGLVEVHGTNHAANERITSRLASGKFDVRKNDLATPKRRAVAGWLERRTAILAGEVRSLIGDGEKH